MNNYSKSQDILWIVIAKDSSDPSEEIQFVTRDKQRAIHFVETNQCDFQEGVFDQVCIFPFALDSYLGLIEDPAFENVKPASNSRWDSLTYSWKEGSWVKTMSAPEIFGGKEAYIDLLNQELASICREAPDSNKN